MEDQRKRDKDKGSSYQGECITIMFSSNKKYGDKKNGSQRGERKAYSCSSKSLCPLLAFLFLFFVHRGSRSFLTRVGYRDAESSSTGLELARVLTTIGYYRKQINKDQRDLPRLVFEKRPSILELVPVSVLTR